MFDVEIKRDQKVYAWDQVCRNNFGHRGKFDGDKERQYTGILGQTVMADLLQLCGLDGPRPVASGFDEGIDFVIEGLNVDLKTMGRNFPVRRSFVNNLVASQLKYQTDVYVFSSINKKTSVMTFIGVFPKRMINQFEIPEGMDRTRADGTTFKTAAGLIEIPVSDLIPCDGIMDLVFKIGGLRA